MHPSKNIALALLLLLAASSATTLGATLSISNGVLEVRGTIDPGDASRIELALDGGAKIVRIHSPGGQLAEALRIGQAIRARGIELRVAGLCSSACAQLVLPGAKTLHIEDGSVIAMHAAAEGAFLSAEREGRFERVPDAVAEAALAPIRKHRNDIADFFEMTNVNAEAMNFMYQLTSTTDVDVSYVVASSGKVDLTLVGRKDPVCRAWLLNADTLRSLGIQASGWRAAGRLKAAFILGEPYDLIYDGPVTSKQELAASIGCAALRESVQSRQPAVKPNHSVKLSANGMSRWPPSAGPSAHFALAVQRVTPSSPAYLKR